MKELLQRLFFPSSEVLSIVDREWKMIHLLWNNNKTMEQIFALCNFDAIGWRITIPANIGTRDSSRMNALSCQLSAECTGKTGFQFSVFLNILHNCITLPSVLPQFTEGLQLIKRRIFLRCHSTTWDMRKCSAVAPSFSLIGSKSPRRATKINSQFCRKWISKLSKLVI